MKTINKNAKTVRLLARIWGSIILAFILFFFLSYLFGEEGLGLDNISNHDKITFIFFPISSIIGLSIAYKNEMLGGLITLLGMVGLFIMQRELITNPYIVIGIVPPGILYLVYWYLTKKQSM